MALGNGMYETGRELLELKKEVIEARNQAIKTDNLIKNLSLDVKGFERRLERLERRTRVASLGVHLVVAMVIASAAAIVHFVRLSAITQELVKEKKVTSGVKVTATADLEHLQKQLKEYETAHKKSKDAEELAAKIVTLLEAKQDSEAIDLVDQLEVGDLSPLGQEVLGKRLVEFKKKAAEAAQKAGKAALVALKSDVAIRALQRCVQIEPQGRYAAQCRYLLATTLWNVRRFKDAEPYLRELLKSETEAALVEELRFMLASSLSRLEQKGEAKVLFEQAVQNNSRFAEKAKEYLTALENAGQLPEGPVMGPKLTKPQSPEAAGAVP